MWNDWLRDFLIVFAAQIQCLRRQHRHTIYLRWLIANGSHDISIRKFRIIAHFSLLLFLCISCPNEVENIANNGPAASWFTSIKWCSASETQTACVCVCAFTIYSVFSCDYSSRTTISNWFGSQNFIVRSFWGGEAEGGRWRDRGACDAILNASLWQPDLSWKMRVQMRWRRDHRRRHKAIATVLLNGKIISRTINLIAYSIIRIISQTELGHRCSPRCYLYIHIFV